MRTFQSTEDRSMTIHQYRLKHGVYQIVQQRSCPEEWAVRFKPRGGSWCWLGAPESRYETTAGAEHAILLHLEA